MPDPIDLTSIPDDLKATDHWVVWKWVTREDKPTKPPFDPTTGRPGDATSPHLWMSLERALSFIPEYDGVGFAISGTPFTGIDLDGCIDESGEVAPWAEAIVKRLDSYTEITPSSRGLRIWVRGKLPPTGRRKGPVELYDSRRYFTVTGNRLGGSPPEILDREKELLGLHAELFPPPTERPRLRPEPQPTVLGEDDILQRAIGARNGAAFTALFEGDTSSFNGDDSAADLALCSKLAFWFGPDPEAIDRNFRKSGLYREKWEREDYRDRTIAKAIDRDTFYEPAANVQLKSRKQAAEENAPEIDHATSLEGDADPHRLARLFFTRPPIHDDGNTLAFWNEEWHRWDRLAWRFVSEREIGAEITATIKTEFDRIAREIRKPPLSVTTRIVGNAMQALRGMALLKLEDYPEQPAWIGPFEPGADLPPPREVLAATNGLVHLPSLVAGESAMLRPTPRFFSPTNLGYAFRSEVGEPLQWLEFLGSVWPDDQESIDSLQEWMGYLLVPDTTQEKILMVIGPKRSGKGTICRLIRALVGPSNVSAPTLSGLALNFGLAPLIGKSVAVIADARLSGRTDSQVIVERLLSISGEDAQTIDRKHREAWTGRLPTRFVLVSNELPRLGDSSGALPSRMILLRMTRSFIGREDTALTARLLSERPAILLWAIAGWARLRERGYFLQPTSGLELLEDLNDLASPTGTFVTERCRVGEGYSVPVKEIYSAWKDYCKEKGRDHPGDEAGFGRSLRAVLPHLKTQQVRRDKDRIREFVGIELGIPF